MVNIIQGTNAKPVSAQLLVKFFTEHTSYNGFLYTGYPIIGTSEGPYPIDALLISPEQGLVVFSLVEGRDVQDFEEVQDDIYNKLESKLRAHRGLMDGRNLQVAIHPVTFASALNDTTSLSSEEYPVCNESNLEAWLNSRKWETPEYYETLLSIIQAISTIRRGRKRRDIQKEGSRGAKLKLLENSIANLDKHQAHAVLETVEGVQRIRGLAGSGKTIVLALKAAYLHVQHPDWKIAVTFNTRSLKGQFRQLINTFVIELKSEEPNWDNLQILHAWGAPGGGERSGIYFIFCQHHGVEYHDYTSAKNSFGRGREFEGVCGKALAECPDPSGIYDVILVDEAQDFPPSFLRLCYEILKPEKRLVYAYDELQNLHSQSLPSPEEIFGNHEDGAPKVSLVNQSNKPQQDVILEKCYRNSRPVLTTAHALGFGIYRKPDAETGTGLVQIFEHSPLWLEIGYEVTSGNLEDGCEVVLSRSDKSSPSFLEDHSPIEDLVQFRNFNSKKEQAEWVADAIRLNLSEDELRADDIIVINPNPLTTRDEVGSIRKRLFEKRIDTHLAGVDTAPDLFFDSDGESVTFTGVFRAKGNEAGMVYIINAQDCYSSSDNMARVRNRLFTAITRSKAWVRVLGVGKDMQCLIDEFEQVKKNNFSLRFLYPTEEQRQYLNIVNRDMSEEERRRVHKKKDYLAQLIDDLESGRVRREDLGAMKIKKLRALLDEEGR